MTFRCKYCNVSTSAYYRWVHSPFGKRDLRHLQLDTEIRRTFEEHKSRYGATRIFQQLKDDNWKVTIEKVSERMRLMGLVSKAAKRFVKTTDYQHNQYTQPNRLQQQFEASKANEKYVTDITYIPTQEGTMYLCVFIDLYSRSVVGWSMADHMRAELVCDALRMTMFRRNMPKNVLVHSDKGSQYTSEKFQGAISEYGLKSSMSGTGCCYDNAACESFFGMLKAEADAINEYHESNDQIYANEKPEYHGISYLKTKYLYQAINKRGDDESHIKYKQTDILIYSYEFHIGFEIKFNNKLLDSAEYNLLDVSLKSILNSALHRVNTLSKLDNIQSRISNIQNRIEYLENELHNISSKTENIDYSSDLQRLEERHNAIVTELAKAS